MSEFLSNHWHDITLWKLDPTPGSEGPFIVLQDAIDSSDPTLTKRAWMLRIDGKWIDLALQFSLTKEERIRTWFENTREVMELLGNLPEHPSSIYHPLDKEETLRSMETIESLDLEWIHARVREWKAEHES